MIGGIMGIHHRGCHLLVSPLEVIESVIIRYELD